MEDGGQGLVWGTGCGGGAQVSLTLTPLWMAGETRGRAQASFACSPVPNRLLTGSGLQPRGWEPLLYTIRLRVQSPGRKIYLGCGFDPQSACVREATYY